MNFEAEWGAGPKDTPVGVRMFDDGQGERDSSTSADVDSERPPQSEPQIEQWLVQTAAGDRRAFRRLYDATSSRLFAQALFMLRRRDVAEDVLQEAYVRVWIGARAFDPLRGRAMPWMGRILRNLAIDRIRRDRPGDLTLDIDDATQQIAAAREPVDDRIDLVRGLDRISPEQRNAVVSVVVEGWTHEEAARRAGMPTPTGKARVARGLKRLRTFQEQDGFDSVDD